MEHNQCLTEPVVTAKDIIDYRQALNMTQEEFSEAFEVPLGTLRRWEQGVSKPAISLAKLNVCNNVLRWMLERKKLKEAA
jgi:DNA-binding transcriptional regulator YiaG